MKMKLNTKFFYMALVLVIVSARDPPDIEFLFEETVENTSSFTTPLPSEQSCALLFVDESAQVNIVRPSSIQLDNTSLASYGPLSVVVVELDAVVQLKLQSGVRALQKSLLYVSKGANISGTESSHLSVGGRLNVSEGVALRFDASRALIMGEGQFQRNSTLEMWDNSVFRIHEGGFIDVDAFGSILLYRSALFEVSEWWQHALIGDVRARATIGPRLVASFLDRSSWQVAKGNFSAQSDVVINLDKQASFLLKGRFNVSSKSRIIIGNRGKLLIGTEHKYDPKSGPSLIFGADGLILEIKDEATLIVEPGAHCLLLQSLTVEKALILSHNSILKPTVACFATHVELKTAAEAVQSNKPICIQI